MKVLISGGSGFIGEALTQRLAKQGERPRILSRHPEKTVSLFAGLSVEVIQGDVTRFASLSKALEGMEVVVQCAQFPGHPVENPWKGQTYWQVDALGTENLIQAAKAAGIRHFLYISGAGTDGTRKEPWFRAKWYAEQALRSSGIRATILRPSWIYGPKDKSLNRIIRTIRYLPFLPMMGWGNNVVQPVFIDDAAEVVAACLASGTKENLTFDVGGPEAMTLRKMMQIVLEVQNKRRLIVPIPKIVMKAAAFPLQFLPTPPLSPKAVDFVTMNVSVDIAPLQKAFPDLRLRTFREGLQTYQKG